MVRSLSDQLLGGLPSAEAPSLTESPSDGTDARADKAPPTDNSASADNLAIGKNGKAKNGQVTHGVMCYR